MHHSIALGMKVFQEEMTAHPRYANEEYSAWQGIHRLHDFAESNLVFLCTWAPNSTREVLVKNLILINLMQMWNLKHTSLL
jgi:hypothetical protein